MSSKTLKVELHLSSPRELSPMEGEEFRVFNSKEHGGCYYVSNFARVYSVPRTLTIQKGGGKVVKREVRGGFLKPVFDSRGRKMVALRRDGHKSALSFLHVVVGETFCKKPKDFDSKRYVMTRMDGSRDNCNADNLVWELEKDMRKHTDCFRCEVVVTDTEGEMKPMRFPSMKACGEHFGASKQCVASSVKKKGLFRGRFMISKVREGYTVEDYIREQGGRKYKC